MRIITGSTRGTRKSDLLRMCGMMSVQQLIAYRMLMVGLGFLYRGEPSYLVNQLKPRFTGPRIRATLRAIATVMTPAHDL